MYVFPEFLWGCLFHANVVEMIIVVSAICTQSVKVRKEKFMLLQELKTRLRAEYNALRLYLTTADLTISGQQYPRELVKARFLKLNMSHVEYVMECLRKNTTKIYNIKAYLLAALFNAGTTMSNYYRAEVNHDMPQFAG